jgi:hypothetical protein
MGGVANGYFWSGKMAFRQPWWTHVELLDSQYVVLSQSE